MAIPIIPTSGGAWKNGVPINANTTPTPSSPAPNSVTQTSTGFSWVDPTTGKTVTINPASQGGYMTAYGNTAQKLNAIANEHQANLKAGLESNNANTNTNYDSAQRQAYVDYMRKQKALPSQLQALGVSGGATESGLLNLYNNYGNEHAANELQRAAELAANQSDYDDKWNTYWENLQTDLADREATAINNQINEYKNDLVNFQNSIARYPTTEKGYEQYKKLIKSLKDGNDPLKDYKIAYVQQQMATQFPKGKPDGGGKSGGGGGGGSSRKRSGYGGGGGNNNSASGSTGDSMTDYYKSVAAKAKNYKNKKTTNVGGKKKTSRGYNIHGTSSKEWQ